MHYDNLLENKKFKQLFDQIGIINLPNRKLTFESLLKIIINQQLSNKVANVIFKRLKELLQDSLQISFHSILEVKDTELRKIGISYSKIKFMKDLSIKFENNPNMLSEWKKLSDDDAKNEIEKLNGFGPWSSNIILLFYLGRKDIFPQGDATLNKAYKIIFNKALDKKLTQINWAKPYRSYLALYLWKWVDSGMKPFN